MIHAPSTTVESDLPATAARRTIESIESLVDDQAGRREHAAHEPLIS